MKCRKIIAITLILVSILLFSFAGYRIFQIDQKVKAGANKTTENTYIQDYDVSKLSFSDLEKEIINIENNLTDKKITLIINEKEYEYTLKEIGIEINKKEIYDKIVSYENSKDYYDNYHSISSNTFEKVIYDYKYLINEEILNSFVDNLSTKVKIIPKKGTLVMGTNKILTYENEVIGYELNKEESISIIKNNFENEQYDTTLNLVGTNHYTNDPLKNINKKISSFSTTFDTSVSRKYNLEAGAKFINGKILNPNEIFSFYETAGPFNRKGYVGYLGVLGNGVCQVATTLYNAQLLAGLKTVKRYNHGTKSVYVDGGLDATVAANKLYITDYKFQNTYKYPLYISAYVIGGKITVEIWSNENATNGITYKVESVQIGYLSYSAYRYGYKEGKQVSKEHLGNSYYYN